ncbi:unnamed protein product [Amaranthus hypochondriacus]
MKKCHEKSICNEKTIGNKFYLALILITIGQCGYNNYKNSLQWEEKMVKLNRFKKRTLERKYGFNQKVFGDINFRSNLKLFWIYTKNNWYVYFGLLISIFVFPYVGVSKRKKLLIRACMMGVSSCIFIAGKLCVYTFEGPKFENPILAVFKVILVAFKNRHFDITTGAYEYYFGTEVGVQNQKNHSDSDIEHGIDGSHIHNQNNDYENKLNLTRKLGFLSKAALYESLPGNPQADLEKRRLFTVKEVEEAKIFLSSALISLTFLIYGIVSSITDNLFVEQANNMDRHFHSIKVPVQVLMASTSIGKSVTDICCRSMFNKPKKRFNGLMRISLGMLASVFCFIIAYIIEVRRLKALKHGVTLSAFWIIPQLILTGIMNGFAENGISNFLANDMPYSIRISYAKLLAQALISGGKLLSIALIAGVNYACKLDDHPRWFGDRINDSRVDKFYLVMMVFAFISFVLCAVTVCVLRLLKSSAPLSNSQDVQDLQRLI